MHSFCVDFNFTFLINTTKKMENSTNRNYDEDRRNSQNQPASDSNSYWNGEQKRNTSGTNPQDNLQQSPEDGRDQNIIPDSNSYDPKTNNSDTLAGSVAAGTNPDRYTGFNEQEKQNSPEDKDGDSKKAQRTPGL
jgi:hypothetical protein